MEVDLDVVSLRSSLAAYMILARPRKTFKIIFGPLQENAQRKMKQKKLSKNRRTSANAVLIILRQVDSFWKEKATCVDLVCCWHTPRLGIMPGCQMALGRLSRRWRIGLKRNCRIGRAWRTSSFHQVCLNMTERQLPRKWLPFLTARNFLLVTKVILLPS